MKLNQLKNVITSFAFVCCLFTENLRADIWVFDINDTVTLLNEVDPQKTTQVILNQLVAQNIYLESDENKSIEQHIKETIESKEDQRKTYGDLFNYASELYKQGLLSRDSCVSMANLLEKYKNANLEANSSFNRGFFPSLFKFIDHILVTDSTPCICIQSFGNEIPHILSVLSERYPDLFVNKQIGEFDGNHNLVLDGKVYEGQEQLVSLLKPQSIVGWKNNYAEGGGKYLFFNTSEDQKLVTRLFDDNALRFARVFKDGILLSHEEGLKYAKRYIYQVDTAKALTNESYFVQSLRKLFYYDEKTDSMYLK